MPGAVGELEDLGEELHVHEPAGAELQVDASRALAAQLRLHAAPDVVDLRALGGREPRPEDARPPERREPPGQRPVPEERAGPHERLALPERGLVREVSVERLEVVGERGGLPALPEAEVQPEDLARSA